MANQSSLQQLLWTVLSKVKYVDCQATYLISIVTVSLKLEWMDRSNQNEWKIMLVSIMDNDSKHGIFWFS